MYICDFSTPRAYSIRECFLSLLFILLSFLLSMLYVLCSNSHVQSLIKWKHLHLKILRLNLWLNFRFNQLNPTYIEVLVLAAMPLPAFEAFPLQIILSNVKNAIIFFFFKFWKISCYCEYFFQYRSFLAIIYFFPIFWGGDVKPKIVDVLTRTKSFIPLQNCFFAKLATVCFF